MSSNKPLLPPEVASKLPLVIVQHIYSFVPKYPKRRSPMSGVQKALELLQQSPKRTAMDLYTLDDFVLK